jgi:(E)-4-hydroxy-3-methylbut-2-enyl-diphosphate synthase
MTITKTADVDGTLAQIYALAGAGADIVRCTCNEQEAAEGLARIVPRSPVPIVADIHFQYRLALAALEAGVHCLRLNPGNIRKPEHIKLVAQEAKDRGVPIRIGVNAGSLDPELLDELMDRNAARPQPLSAAGVVRQTMVESALRSAAGAEELGLPHDAIVLSCKASQVGEMVATYRQLAARCDYPLHLGLTEAGMGTKGVVATAAALGLLLAEGIGETIRASLTPDPGGDRTIEVAVCLDLLQSLGLRAFRPQVTACPGCGRTTSTVFQELAQGIERRLAERMAVWRHERPDAASLRVAVMGCIVNGPGESRAANIGLSLPGTGEEPRAPVYVDGLKVATLEGPTLAEDFMRMVEEYVERTYPAARPAVAPAR